MEPDASIEDFIFAIRQLDPDPPIFGKVWYLTQREHWLGWLENYDGPGYYGRTSVGPRNAKMVFNRIVEPKMLEWLVRASGARPELHAQVAKCLELNGTMNQQSAAIRKLVPWEAVAKMLAIVPEPHTRRSSDTPPATKQRALADSKLARRPVKRKPH